jgi:hypothetical protein
VHSPMGRMSEWPAWWRVWWRNKTACLVRNSPVWIWTVLSPLSRHDAVTASYRCGHLVSWIEAGLRWWTSFHWWMALKTNWCKTF